jgi:hypothetical protein
MISSELLKTSENHSEIFQHQGILAIHEARGDRLLLSYTQKYNNEISEMQKECNGLILDKTTFEIIAYPPPVVTILNDEPIPNDIVSYSYVSDGTSLLLYFYDGRWRISTQRAYEVNNMKPPGIDLSYGEMFFSIITKYHLASFNKDVTYNFILQHNKIHSLVANESFLIFVAAFDKTGRRHNVTFPKLAYFLIDMDEQTYVPITKEELTESMDYCEVDLSKNIYRQDYIPHRESLMQELSETNTNNYRKMCQDAYDEHINGTVKGNFGLILTRSNGHRLLIESTLMSKVRTALYSNEIMDDLKKNRSFTRDNLVSMLAITKQNNYFPLLFLETHTLGQVYRAAYTKYDNLCADLVQKCRNPKYKLPVLQAAIHAALVSATDKNILNNENINILFDTVKSFLNSNKMKVPLYAYLFEEA